MDIKDKVVIVTGASSGIGRACALDLVKHGALVTLASRSEQALCDIADEVDPSGRRTLVVPTDVTDVDQCRRMVEETVAYFGRVDVLVNNAGISMRASFSELDLDVMHKLMDVNFWGTVYSTKAALPYLLKSKGTIVGVTSVAGYLGLPWRTGYSASKYAMRGFLDTIRTEYLHSGLKVFVIAPGFTASNIRYKALTADGSEQGESPRNEGKMMSAEKVACEIRKGICRGTREKVLTLIEGKLAVFLNKWCPSLVDRLANSKMRKEFEQKQ